MVFFSIPFFNYLGRLLSLVTMSNLEQTLEGRWNVTLWEVRIIRIETNLHYDALSKKSWTLCVEWNNWIGHMSLRKKCVIILFIAKFLIRRCSVKHKSSWLLTTNLGRLIFISIPKCWYMMTIWHQIWLLMLDQTLPTLI